MKPKNKSFHVNSYGKFIVKTVVGGFAILNGSAGGLAVKLHFLAHNEKQLRTEGIEAYNQAEAMTDSHMAGHVRDRAESTIQPASTTTGEDIISVAAGFGIAAAIYGSYAFGNVITKFLNNTIDAVKKPFQPKKPPGGFTL